MAGLASIPPKHLTARAYEWLTTAGVYYGKGNSLYKLPIGIAAHGEKDDKGNLIDIYVNRGWCCGVEDMRAIYIGMSYTIKYVNGGRKSLSKWSVGTLIQPTCLDCLVLMDQAMESVMPKQGEYIIAVPDTARPYWAGPQQYKFLWVRGKYKANQMQPIARGEVAPIELSGQEVDGELIQAPLRSSMLKPLPRIPRDFGFWDSLDEE